MLMDEDEEYNIRIGDYILHRKIGEGNFSTVWIADSLNGPEPVAVKVIPKKIVNRSKDSLTRFNREISMLKHIDHPFISHLFEIMEDEHNYYLVIEYAENGNMLNFIKSRGNLNEIMSRHFFSELITVLDYLHNECKIAHRDLKPENILLDRFNNIRIIDFGLSNTFTDADEYFDSTCGSPAFTAPEIIMGKRYSKAADVWSAGIILYQMITGNLPFYDENVTTLLQKIVNQDIKFPTYLPPLLVDLLKKMLDKSMERRITLKQIMEHPWVVQGGLVAALENTIAGMRQSMSVDNSIIYQIELRGIKVDVNTILCKDERPKHVSIYLQYSRSKMILDLCSRIQAAKTALPLPPPTPTPRSLPHAASPMLRFVEEESRPESAPTKKATASRPDIRVVPLVPVRPRARTNKEI